MKVGQQERLFTRKCKSNKSRSTSKIVYCVSNGIESGSTRKTDTRQTL